MCKAVRRGEILGRADVNYWRLTPFVAQRLENPKFPVVALEACLSLVQYGSSQLAKAEPPGAAMLRMNNLQDDGWDLSDVKFVQLSEKELQTYRLVPGDILLNRTNSKELVGKCAVFRQPDDWVFASYLIRVRTIADELIPEFASDFLGTVIGRLQIDRLSRQIIGMTNINAEEIRELRIPLPPRQKQIELVSAMDAARAARRRKLDQADSVLRGIDAAVLRSVGLTAPLADSRTVFGVRLSQIRREGRTDPYYHHPRFTKLLEDFSASKLPKARLGELSPEIAGGATPTKGNQELYTSDGVRFLRILNIKANDFDLADLNHIRLEVHEGELKRSQLEAGDVLLTITGRVGTAAVVTPDLLPANINQHIARLRLTGDVVTPEFLAVFLNSSVGLALSNQKVTGGTRIALDYGAVRSIPIPIAPPLAQKRVTDEASSLRERAKRLRAEADSAWQGAKRWLEEQLLEPTD